MKVASGVQSPERSGFPDDVRGAGPLGAAALSRSAVAMASRFCAQAGRAAIATITMNGTRILLLFRPIVTPQPANPDVAVAHRLLVILQHQGIFGGLRRVLRELAMHGGSHQFLVVV